MIPQRFSVAEWRRWLDPTVLVLAVICIAFAIGGDALRELARYERGAILAGEYWRLLSGQLVHLGWGHLWLNVIALLILGTLFGDVLSARDWLVTGLVATAAIDLGLLLVAREIEWYVGLSGVLHGYTAVGALRVLRRGEVVGLLLIVGLVAKLLYEQVLGPLPLTADTAGGPVVVAAHLYGAGGAVALELGRRVLSRRASRL